jgi:hypothetical protein
METISIWFNQNLTHKNLKSIDKVSRKGEESERVIITLLSLTLPQVRWELYRGEIDGKGIIIITLLN